MSEFKPMRSPGVKFPPPVCFAGPWLVGYGVQHLLNLPLVPPTLGPLAHRVGGIMMIAALLTLAWAISRFLLAGTSLIPHKPADAFVVSGPYRVTRNPMYLAMATLHLGSALYDNALFLGVGVPMGMLLMQRFVIAREERYLAQRFGAEYEAYRARVRRWL
jgi:protein-S-isoprenylcysteine O-methyltransferase Ste14